MHRTDSTKEKRYERIYICHRVGRYYVGRIGSFKRENRGGSSDQNPYYKNNTPPPVPPAYTQPPSAPQPSRQPVGRETQAMTGTQVKQGSQAGHDQLFGRYSAGEE